MKKFRYLVFLVFLLIISFNVQAKSLDRFYADAGESISLNDDVNGSSFLAGSSVDSLSNVDGANFMAGNNINFSGSSQYAIAAGNFIDIKGSVLKDTVIAGNIINIKKDSSLERVLLFLAMIFKLWGVLVEMLQYILVKFL